MNAATRSLLATCIALVGLSTVAPADAQSVYSWKDAKGVTHYADAPPPKGTAKKREVHVTAASADATASATAAAKAKSSDEAAAKAEAPRPDPDPKAVAARLANCKTAQANLAMLGSAAPVGVDNDGDGKTDAVFTAEQRAKQTQAMQASVAASCSP